MYVTVPPTPRTSRRGFTLIELCVCAGILAVLIGLLLPSVQGARAQAKAVRCRDQLRQVGVTLADYAAKNNGTITPMEYTPPFRKWPQLLFGTARPPVVVCPTAAEHEWLSYQWNLYLIGRLVTLGRTRGVPSTEVPLAGENVVGSNTDYSTLDDGATIWDPYRHGPVLRSNVLYLDFHVSNDPPILRPGASDPWCIPVGP